MAYVRRGRGRSGGVPATATRPPPTSGATSSRTSRRRPLPGARSGRHGRLRQARRRARTASSTTRATSTPGSRRSSWRGAVTLVVHDWGSALGFDWARRHPERVRGVVYMEAIVRPVTWDEWPEAARKIFQGMRVAGRRGDGARRRTCSWSGSCPRACCAGSTEAEMAVYRRPYLEPGESRRPTLTWPRADPDRRRARRRRGHRRRLRDVAGRERRLPKLFVNADPGVILAGAAARVLPALAEPAGGHRAGAATSSRRTRRTRSARRWPRSSGACRADRPSPALSASGAEGSYSPPPPPGRGRGEGWPSRRNSRRTRRNSSRRSWWSQWPARVDADDARRAGSGAARPSVGGVAGRGSPCRRAGAWGRRCATTAAWMSRPAHVVGRPRAHVVVELPAVRAVLVLVDAVHGEVARLLGGEVRVLLLHAAEGVLDRGVAPRQAAGQAALLAGSTRPCARRSSSRVALGQRARRGAEALDGDQLRRPSPDRCPA